MLPSADPEVRRRFDDEVETRATSSGVPSRETGKLASYSAIRFSHTSFFHTGTDSLSRSMT